MYDELELDKLGDRKTALFLIMSDTDSTFNFLIREGLKAQKSEKARAAYRQANESDFIIAEAAARYFKAQGLTKLPGRKALQAEIEQLISEKDGLYNTYHEQKQRFRELQTVKRNIDQILRREEPHRRKEQSHER